MRREQWIGLAVASGPLARQAFILAESYTDHYTMYKYWCPGTAACKRAAVPSIIAHNHHAPPLPPRSPQGDGVDGRQEQEAVRQRAAHLGVCVRAHALPLEGSDQVSGQMASWEAMCSAGRRCVHMAWLRARCNQGSATLLCVHASEHALSPLLPLAAACGTCTRSTGRRRCSGSSRGGRRTASSAPSRSARPGTPPVVGGALRRPVLARCCSGLCGGEGEGESCSKGSKG